MGDPSEGKVWICSVCREREAVGFVLCKPCGRSYDRYASERSIADVIEWTAKRALRFERKRARKKSS